MCTIVIINKGEKEIGTPKDFYEHFGFYPPRYDYYDDVDPSACLCQVDIEKGLTENNIPFKKDCGDIFVGMLDEVVGDSDD